MNCTLLPLGLALAAALVPGCHDPTSVASPGGDGGLPDLAGAVPVTPTVSAWRGTNVAADLSRVDITYQLTPFNTGAGPKDANGYPAPGVSGTSQTDIGFVLPSGMYKVSYQGTGTLAVSGIAKLIGGWQAAGGEQRGVLSITGTPGAFGNFLTLTVTNAPGQSVTGIHIYYPGLDYDAPLVFLPQFLALLGPFRALRFMEWQNINGSKLANWTDRPASAHFGASAYGQPYEHIVALINQTGKDAWISVPELATDAFIQSLAQFLAQGLDFGQIQAARTAQGFTTPFELVVENSNETWNQGFSAYGTFLAAAKGNPARYTGTYSGAYGPAWMTGNGDLMRVGQYEADRLAHIATAFRAALGAAGHADCVSPVLSGWALGAGYSDVGMRFLQDNYGDPKAVVSRVAIAPYFGPTDAQTGSLPALFAGASQNIQSMDATFQDFAKLAMEYGVKMTAYEGGQGISGNTNLAVKHLAQHDQRMYDAYKQYLGFWHAHFGDALFMHFDLAGTPGIPESFFQYGFWGSIASTLEDPATCGLALPTLTGTETVASVVHHCPKYRALAELP